MTLIREFVAEHNARPFSDIPEFAEGHDLFDSGDLDSLGFVELLTFLGSRTGRFVDLSDVDPSELTRVGAVAAHFSDQGRA